MFWWCVTCVMVRVVVTLVLFMCVFFFFSSRRRHTRYIGDWSSDVCSSDLFYIIVKLDSIVRVSFTLCFCLRQGVFLLWVGFNLDRKSVV